MQDFSVFDKKEQEAFNQVFKTFECWLDDYVEQFNLFTSRIQSEFFTNLRELKEQNRFGCLDCVLNQSFQFSVTQSEQDLRDYFENKAQLRTDVIDRIKEAQEKFKNYITKEKQNYISPSDDREKLRVILFKLSGLDKVREQVEAEYEKALQALTSGNYWRKELITMNKLREIYQVCESERKLREWKRLEAQRKEDAERVESAKQQHLLRIQQEQIEIEERERQMGKNRMLPRDQLDHMDQEDVDHIDIMRQRDQEGAYRRHEQNSLVPLSSQNSKQEYKQPDPQIYQNRNMSEYPEILARFQTAIDQNQVSNLSQFYIGSNLPSDQAQKQQSNLILQTPQRSQLEKQQGSTKVVSQGKEAHQPQNLQQQFQFPTQGQQYQQQQPQPQLSKFGIQIVQQTEGFLSNPSQSIGGRLNPSNGPGQGNIMNLTNSILPNGQPALQPNKLPMQSQAGGTTLPPSQANMVGNQQPQNPSIRIISMNLPK